MTLPAASRRCHCPGWNPATNRWHALMASPGPPHPWARRSRTTRSHHRGTRTRTAAWASRANGDHGGSDNPCPGDSPASSFARRTSAAVPLGGGGSIEVRMANGEPLAGRLLRGEASGHPVEDANVNCRGSCVRRPRRGPRGCGRGGIPGPPARAAASRGPVGVVRPGRDAATQGVPAGSMRSLCSGVAVGFQGRNCGPD